MTRITEVATVGVPVTDQDRALHFYAGTLGFDKRLDAPFGPGLRWIEVAPAGASTTVASTPAPPGARVGVDTGIRLTTRDAQADHTELTAAASTSTPRSCAGPACRRCSPCAIRTAMSCTSWNGSSPSTATPPASADRDEPPRPVVRPLGEP